MSLDTMEPAPPSAQEALGLRCPFCDHVGSLVKDSRPSGNAIRRRRKCDACHARFTTYELTSAGDELPTALSLAQAVRAEPQIARGLLILLRDSPLRLITSAAPRDS